MKEELQSYQVGIHNIYLRNYRNKIDDTYWRAHEYKFDGVITEETIANQILEIGF